MKLGEFIEKIMDAGWKASCDAQHTEIKKVYNQIFIDNKAQHTDDFGNTHTKTFEDKMEYINLTYAEAWQALKDGKDVFMDGQRCYLSTDIYIIYLQSGKFVTFHPTDKLFKMKKEPEFESLGLSDDCVEINVFGVKVNHPKDSSYIFFVEENGVVRDSSGYWRAKIKYKGDYTKAKIKVTVDKDGNITYKDVA
jgi:hypothetical protein